MDTLEIPVTSDPDGAYEVAPRVDERRVRGPAHRPPFASRFFVGLLGLGAMLITVALLLSDRAPGALRSVFGDRVRDLWARIDASGRVDLPPGSELPPTDFLVHIAIWAVVTTLVGLAIWSWRGLVFAAVVLLGTGIALELAQGRYATTRQVEFHDVVANGIGIGAGVLVSALCYGAWSGVASLTRRARTR